MSSLSDAIASNRYCPRPADVQTALHRERSEAAQKHHTEALTELQHAEMEAARALQRYQAAERELVLATTQRIGADIVLQFPNKLTQKQMEILPYMLQGKTYPWIAEYLGLTPRTVKFRAGEILAKYGMKNKAALMAALINPELRSIQ